MWVHIKLFINNEYLRKTGFIYSSFFPRCLPCIRETKMYYSWEVSELLYANASDFFSGFHIQGNIWDYAEVSTFPGHKVTWRWGCLASFCMEEALRIFQALEPCWKSKRKSYIPMLKPYKGDTIIPILQIKIPRQRDIKYLAPNHKDSKNGDIIQLQAVCLQNLGL